MGGALAFPLALRIGHDQSLRLRAARLSSRGTDVLAQDLIERARSSGFHTVLAVCCEESVGMIRMLDSLGFKVAGRFREVGIKFGRRLDVVYLQLLL